MGNIAQCRDENPRLLTVKNAGFVQHVANGFLDMGIMSNQQLGMVLGPNVRNVMGPGILKPEIKKTSAE